MTKKQRMYEKIRQHGENIKKIFYLSYNSPWEFLDPVKLCKQLRRLETKGNRIATEYYYGDINQETFESEKDKILRKLQDILGVHSLKDWGVFFNLDPRGYALKINDSRVREFNLEIHRDMGGYGIIAPDFNE